MKSVHYVLAAAVTMTCLTLIAAIAIFRAPQLESTDSPPVSGEESNARELASADPSAELDEISADALDTSAELVERVESVFGPPEDPSVPTSVETP